MRKILRLLKVKNSIRLNYDFYSYLYFRFHFLFFNRLILNGQKIKAFNFFIFLKYRIKNIEKLNPYFIFLVSMINMTPLIYLLSKKKKGSDLSVPLPITEKKQLTFTIKWIAKASKNNRRKISIDKLVDNLILSIYNKGPVIAKKMESYLIARENRYLLRFYK